MRELTIAHLIPGEISHDMIFDLWFKVPTHKSEVIKRGHFIDKRQYTNSYVWVKVQAYRNDKYYLNYEQERYLTREQLFKYDYAMKPKKDYIESVITK